MKKILKYLLFALIFVIVIGTFVMLWQKSRPKVTEYEVVDVTQGSIKITSVATGKLSPRDEVLIKPQISGIISELHKEAGDFVKVGEVIAVVKVIPDMGQLSSAESRVRVAAINFARIEAEHKRQKELFEKGVISKEEMDTSDADFQKSREEQEDSRSNLEIVRDGVSKKSSQTSNTQIRSTITGMILDVPVKVGNSVIMSNTFNDGTTIASVADMRDLIFVGKIDETEVGRVRDGMHIKLTIGAIENVSYDAVLEYISPKGVEESGAILFEIKAAAEIPETTMVRAGYSANAEIVLDTADSVLLVPESVMTFESDSVFVYLLADSIKKPHVFDKHPITIGLSNGVSVEVKSGLELGQKVRGNAIVNVK